MTAALHSSPRRRTARLQEASLLEGPMILLRSIRGLSSHRSLMWLACVPIALFGLGRFNLAAHAAGDGGVTLSIEGLASNLWILVAAVLVIFMNAGFAMVEAGMCRQKNAVNILAKNLFVFALAVTAYWFVGYSVMYGDAVAAGRIMAQLMRQTMYEQFVSALNRGVPMIAPCNGFQIAVQLGLLPGPVPGHAWPSTPPEATVALAQNTSARFIDKWVGIDIPENTRCIWTKGLDSKSTLAMLPIAHGEGRFVPKDDDQLLQYQPLLHF